MEKADIGLIGLAVMGQNLVLNMADHGFRVAVYNRTTTKVDEFVRGPGRHDNVIPTHDLEAFAQALSRPRKVMLMVKAGEAVDATIQALLPHLEAGDIVIDGGNSLYTDTERRVKELAAHGIHFVGMGVSGGEEGARHGPALMPGGDPAAWPEIRNIFETIAAKVDGEPCCKWMGEGGAGHYVKMVHNGIEYGDMQLIAEAYQLLREGVGLDPEALHEVFDRWNRGVLESYLIEITRDILAVRDEDGTLLLDKILDAAGQKGTGRWTAIDALELGVPLTLISEAVFARNLSAMKEARLRASEVLRGPEAHFDGDPEQAVAAIHDALYCAKIVSYAQGFMLLRAADEHYGWKLRYGDIALTWRGGCIIRSRFLNDIAAAYAKAPDLENLLLDDFFRAAIHEGQAGWRDTVALGVRLGLPTPALASALAFFDGYRSERLPANLIQAQRDYFGAHTYERMDRPRGEFFHSDWAGLARGGEG